ncbi:MAG: hypothetical protein WDZ41_04960 [Candidatus Babeliales bacterium]
MNQRIIFLSISVVSIVVIGISMSTSSLSSTTLDNQKAKELIESLYNNISGFGIDNTESAMIEQKGGAPTYGEITYESAQQLLNDLKLTQKDIFYDLGSGVGKMTIQTYLTTPVKKSVGIELSPTRYKYAMAIKQQLSEQKYLDPNRTLDFKNQNIAEADLSDATVVYMCSTCYSEDLMQKIVNKLANMPKGLRIVTLKKLPKHKKFTLVNTFCLPMTWSSNTSVYLYQLQ